MPQYSHQTRHSWHEILMMETKAVSETLDPTSTLMWLIVQEDFIVSCNFQSSYPVFYNMLLFIISFFFLVSLSCVLIVTYIVAYSWISSSLHLLFILKFFQSFRSSDGYTGRSQDSIVIIVTSYRLDNCGVGVWVAVGSRIFSSPHHPDGVWGPPNLLPSGYRGQSGRGMKLTNHLQLVPRSRKCWSVHTLPYTPSWHSAWLVNNKDNCTFYHLCSFI
jgi:hypothetical protein